MRESGFFATSTEASRKKHRIVAKYFGGWANVVLPAARAREGMIMYADLFSGPGKYEDGTPSTPLLILEHAIATPALHNTLRILFNDEDADHINALKRHIAALPGIEHLKHYPKFYTRSIGRESIARIKRINAPTLFFADPFGYEGISIDLIAAALSHWGSDFLFFFNYNRINMHLGNDVMHEPINEFFTPDRATELREVVARLRPAEREAAILNAMRGSVEALGAKVEKFTYRSKTGTRPTHHLMCASKHRNGIALFKEISAKESTRIDDNVPSLTHDPADDPQQGVLFSQITDLEDELLETFAGKKNLTAEQIYHDHHNNRPYVLKNYRQALLHLVESGAIAVDPPAAARQKPGTLPATARLTFPSAG